MACIINGVNKDSELYKSLEKSNLGSARNTMNDYLITQKELFKDWYKANYKADFDTVKVDGRTIKTIKKLVDEYKRTNEYHIYDNNSVVGTTATGIFGDDIAKETHAIKILSDIYLKGERMLLATKRDVTIDNIKKVFINSLKSQYIKNKETLSNEQKEYLTSLVKAVATNNDLLELVLRQPKVVNLSKQLNAFDMLSKSIVGEDETAITIDEEDNDSNYKAWDANNEQLRSVDKTMSQEVKYLFDNIAQTNTANKTGETGLYDYSVDTFSGIPESTSFNDYLKIVMTKADYRNVDAFLDSLYKLANMYNDVSSLTIIADKLSTDRNLLNLTFNNFNQQLIGRNQLEFNNSGENIIATPKLSNRKDFAKWQMFDHIQTVSLDTIYNAPNINTIRNNFIKYKSLLANKLTTDSSIESNYQNIINLFKNLNLNISEEAINKYYANLNGDERSKQTMLLNNIDLYIKNLNESNLAVKANNKLIKEHNQLQYKAINAARAQYDAGDYEMVIPDFIPIDNSKLTEVATSALNNEMFRIAETFAEYQNVDIDFNSHNIEGNLVSDVIKPSFISKYFERLTNKEAAIDYLRFKATLLQNANSNILFEKYDDNGKVERPGLLRKLDNNSYELTEYYQFLQSELFDGARNSVLGKNATYSKLTATDYTITGVNEYVNETYGNSHGDGKGFNFKTAKYFIQTPSDAPKSFLVTSYKLPISGLITADGINRNHPIFKSLRDIAHQEYLSAAQAIDSIFEHDATGKIKFVGSKKLGTKEPVLKPNIKLDDLYNNYHTIKGKLFNDKGLVGNVFQMQNLNIDESDKASADTNMNMLTDADGNKLVDFLYGGINRQSDYLHFTTSDNGDITLNFTDAQSEAIDSYLEKYINAKSEEAVTELSKHKDSIQNYSDNLAKEFALNYTIQYNNFNEMFNGSAKFYKDRRDTIKRNKEIIAGGISNAAASFDYARKTFDNIKIGNKELELSNQFNYITLNDVSLPSANIESIKAMLEKTDASKEAKAIILDKFTSKTDFTDAQSYITLDEFIRRASLFGTLDKYTDTIEALMDETKPLDSSKLSDFIQVQKHFYFSHHFDGNLGIEVPIQIKNAEFVLIPRFIKGTELEVLNDRMVANKIGQVNFNSTEKSTTNKRISFFDTDGSLTDSSLSNFDTKVRDSIKLGWYQDLYKQQDTPQHIDDVNKAGVQIVKKMLDNISNDANGAKLVNDFFTHFTANIEDSFDTLTKDIGVTRNEDGTFVFDYATNKVTLDATKFYKMIYDEFSRLGADSNTFDYATLDENGNPLMPSEFPSVSKKIMSVFQSVFTNNITRQTIPGFHASQISNIGIKENTVSDAKLNNISQSEFEVNHASSLGRKLEYHKGETTYIECLLPKHSKDLYTTYNEDGTVKREFTVEDLEKAGLNFMIGYRIPTEGKQSVVKLKVVGFLDESQGSTIVLPDEFVTQTGSDFDIDSVYGMYHEFYINKNNELNRVEYNESVDRPNTIKRYLNYIKANTKESDLTNAEVLMLAMVDGDTQYELDKAEMLASKSNLKSFDKFSELSVSAQNTRAARNNEIINTFLKIMDNPASWQENFMCSNFEDIKSAKAKAAELVGEDKEYVDTNSFFGQAKYRNQVMSGAQLKAISVKLDGMASISNVSKAIIKDDKSILVSYPLEMKQQLLARYGNENVEITDKSCIVNHNMIGWSLDNCNVDGQLLTPYSSQTTALMLDGVKEGGIKNVNNYTFEVFKLLANVGVNYNTSIAFMYQPAISDISNTQISNESIFGSGEMFDSVNTAKRNYLIKLVELTNQQIEASNLDLQAGALDDEKPAYRTKLELNKNKDGEVINTIQELNSMLGNILNTNAILKDKTISLNSLNRRLSSIDSPVEGQTDSQRLTLDYNRTLFDLSIANIFSDYQSIANSISKHAAVLATDKLGAGQSISDVDKLLYDINNIKTSTTMVKLESAITNTPLIDAVYPKTNYNDIDNIMESVYPSLYAQLKYSALGSKIIVGSMFKTYSPEFSSLRAMLNTTDAETNEAFNNYIVSLNLNKSSFVNNNNFSITKNHVIDAGQKGSSELFDSPDLINLTAPDDLNNRKRIFGYESAPLLSFDFNNISVDNVSLFMQLSPANKVLLMKRYLDQPNTIFDYLDVRLTDTRKANQGLKSKQSIRVKNTMSGYSDMIGLFSKLYNSKDIFAKLTALDMVRYSIVVEGSKFKAGTISKIIPNNILYNSYDKGGLSVIDDLNKNLNSYLSSPLDSQTIFNFYKTFSNSKNIPAFQNKVKRKGEFIRFDQNNVATISKDLLKKIGGMKVFGSIEVAMPMIKTNKAVKGNKNFTMQLYAIKYDDYFEQAVLYPVNQMEQNEIGNVSANPDNSKFGDNLTYDTFISKIMGVTMNKDLDVNDVTEPFDIPIDKRSKLKISIPRGTEVAEAGRFGQRQSFALMNATPEQFDTYATLLDNDATSFVVRPNDYIAENIKNTYNNINEAIAQGKRIIMIEQFDGNFDTSLIDKLVNANYRNFAVISNNKNSKVNRTIALLNIEDRKVELARRVEQIKVTQSVLNTDNDSYHILKNHLFGETGNSGLVMRLNSNNVNYFTETNLLLYKINLAPFSHAVISNNNHDYVVSNLGLINNKTKLASPEYLNNKEDFDNTVGKQITTVDKNILKVQTIEQFITSLDANMSYESALEEIDRNLESFISATVNKVNAISRSREDESIEDIKKGFKQLNLTFNNQLEFNDKNRLAALVIANEFVNTHSAFIINKFNNFYGSKIDDEDIYNYLNENPDTQIEYLKVLDSVNTFINDFHWFSNIADYDISKAKSLGADEAELYNLSEMNKAINQIKTDYNKIDSIKTRAIKARKGYINNILSAESTNPLIVNQVIKLTDAFDDENFAQLNLAPTEESNVPLVQVVLNKVMGQLKTAELNAQDKRVEVNAKLEEFEVKGANVNEIIKDGKLITNIDETLYDDLRQLKHDLRIAEIIDPDGKSGDIYYAAKRKLEKFNMDNIERPYVANYYNDKYNLDSILSAYPESRKVVQQVTNERAEILGRMIGGDYTRLSPEDTNRLNELRKVMNDLQDPYDSDGQLKTNQDEISAVISYQKAKLAFNTKYNEQVVKDTFNNLYKQYNEDLKYPETSQRHIDAAEWIKNNTSKVLEPKFSGMLNGAFQALKTSIGDDKFIGRLSYDKHDDTGVVDGRLFTSEEISRIKNYQDNKYSKGETIGDSVRLLRNSPVEESVYTPEFYDNLASKIKSKLKANITNDINDILMKYFDKNDKNIKTYNISMEDNNKLISLYNQLDTINTEVYVKGDNVIISDIKGDDAARAKWIANNVDFNYNMKLYNLQSKKAKEVSDNYHKKWLALNSQDEYLAGYYTQLAKMGSDLYKLLPNEKNGIDKAIKVLNYYKLNQDYLSDESIKDIESNPAIKKLINKLVGRTYESENDNIADIISSNLTTTANKAILKEKAKIAFSKKGTAIDEINIATKYGNFDTTSTYKAEAALRDLSSDSKFEDKWFIENHTINDNGDIVPTYKNIKFNITSDTGEQLIKNMPNKNIYGTIAPKASVKTKYTNEAKTNAARFIKDHVKFENTKYYDATYAEMSTRSDEEFQTWFDNNHVFNPYTYEYEPLKIWQEMTVNDKSNYTVQPKDKWLNTKVKDEYANPLNQKGKTTISSNSKYNNSDYNKLSQPNKELSSYVSGLLNELVKDKRSRAYIDKGYIPSEEAAQTKKGYKDYVDSFKNAFGWYDTKMQSEIDEMYGRRDVNMPMLHSQGKQLPFTKMRPKGETESNEDYVKFLNDRFESNKVIEEANRKSNLDASNKDFKSVLDTFIRKAYQFNAAQDSGVELRIALEELKSMEFLKRNSKGNILIEKGISYITGNDEVARQQSGTTRVAEHFEHQMNKILRNEFEKDQGNWSKLSRVARNLVSSRFMMLNITGGISNVLYGKTQILMERTAREFFNYTDFNKAEWDYKDGIVAMFANRNKETSDNLVDAIIKTFNVINIDDINEITTDSKIAKNLTSIAYMQQSIGEHYMQNVTLLAMLISHRVININGKTKVMSFDSYNRETRESTLRDILKLKDESNGTNLLGDYESFISNIKSSTISTEQYARFKKDIIQEFLMTQDNETKQLFASRYEETSKNLKTDFNSFPTFREQFELKGGYARLKDGSDLSNIEIGKFRKKVIDVNHSIHGVYDKIGANKFQSTAFGGIAMQFHKHLVPGFAKRFGYRLGHMDGIYSESREAVYKGTYISLAQFLATPFKKGFNKSDVTNEVEAIEGLRGLGNNILEFTTNFKTYYNILPEYDKANMRRSLGELAGIVKAMLLFIAGKMILDDDDKETQTADYVLNLADRLSSEAIQYTPMGMVGEAGKLYKSPIAALPIAQDLWKGFGAAFNYYASDDPNDIIYKSGSYAGMSKLKVAIWRQIPIANQVLKHDRLGRNNSYFKVRDNSLSFIKDWYDKK